jgi:hypothetical protein
MPSELSAIAVGPPCVCRWCVRDGVVISLAPVLDDRVLCLCLLSPFSATSACLNIVACLQIFIGQLFG